MTDLLDKLRAHEPTAAWVDALDSAGDPPAGTFAPLSEIDLPEALRAFEVPETEITALTALLPEVERSTALRRLIERAAWSMVRRMGEIDGQAPFPLWPETTGPLGHCASILVFVVARPHTLAYHRAHGIPDEISRATLRDVGRSIRHHRNRNGSFGLDVPGWLTRHFQGLLFELGRLQFERERLDEQTGQAIADAGLPFGPGDPVLSIHIPDYAGPMTPAACDDAFARALSFFPRHIPEQPTTLAVCHSWLLDPQLGDYLAPTSNIIRFQRRFRHAHYHVPDNTSVLRFVFGRIPPDLSELPRQTTLQRALLDHVAAGRDWHFVSGWLLLADQLRQATTPADRSPRRG